MRAAGLKAIDTVIESTAVLIGSKHPSNSKLVDLIVSRIKGVISQYITIRELLLYLLIMFTLGAQAYVLLLYNVPRSLLEAATKITPGKRAPTITALEEADWVAVSSMVEKSLVATMMDELTECGATDLLVLDIKNSRTG